MNSLQPANDCREIFSGDFYRMSSPENADNLISPAAVLKLLVAILLGTEDSTADQSFWDLDIKHIDEERLIKEAKKEDIWDMGYSMQVRERLEGELSDYIKDKVLINFFKNDFSELNDKVEVENFFATDGKLTIKMEYARMVQEFFNIKHLNKTLAEEKQLITTEFPVELVDSKLDIFGTVSFKLNFPPPFYMHEDGSFEAVGQFKYKIIKNRSSLDFRTEVLEVALDGPLKMLIFIPNDFSTLLTQSIGRDYTDFNKISEKLKTKCVHVKLPKLNMDFKRDLRDFFAETSHRGLREFFNEAVLLTRIFEDAEDLDFTIGKFWQHTSLEINASTENFSTSQCEPEIVFDAIQKSILFVIKSDKVMYLMGHLYKPE